MSRLLILVLTFCTKYNIFNVVHVDAAFQNFNQIENQLNIKEFMSKNVLVMSNTVDTVEKS